MFNHLRRGAGIVLLCLAAMPGRAAAPRVAVDIPPVHALVAQVMAGVGAPDLIVAPGTSPHGYALRPSEARTLQDADLVVWVGPDLTPWLGAALPWIAADARIVTLAHLPETRTLPLREAADFAAPAPGGGAGHAADRRGAIDPHLWLDPANARAWLDVLAGVLAEIDPANAARYADNAAAAQADLAALERGLAARLAADPPAPFVVFHDAFQYFERAFDVPAAGAIVLGDGSDPSPARIAEIRDVVRARGIACAFAEPQLNTALVDTVVAESGATLALVDPLGAVHAPGPALYGAILRDLADALAGCGARG